MLFSKKKTTGSAVSKKGKKHYKIKYVYKTDSDLENSVEIDSENDELESPEEVIETKRGKHKIPLDKDKDVKEPVRKSHKKHVDSSDKSDKSEDKSDETGTNDMENVNTSKETVSVETVSKPAAQPSNDFTYAWKSTVISWITIISKHDARDAAPNDVTIWYPATCCFW